MNQEQYFKRGLEIVHTLTTFAYEAYLVGGVVRDYIMHNDFVDIDIATSATPDEVLAIFPNARTEYKDLGFVLLKEDDMVFEISTFKIEEYNVPRKPSKIYYAQSLVDDVKRRDFTVNALALTDNCQIIDLVKGQKDIKLKAIRVIGQPKKRFKEDPLRILRAYSLVGRFNFTIDYKTSRGIIASNKYLNLLSNNQISKELYKIMTSAYGAKAIRSLVGYHTNEHLADYHDGLNVLSAHYNKFTTAEKFALCYAGASGIPENTCFDKAMLAEIKQILDVVEKTKNITKKDEDSITAKEVFLYGEENLLSALKINFYLNKKYPNLIRKVKKISKEMPIKQMGDLAFHGSDLVQLNGGISGAFIKQIMDELANEVVLGMIRNDYRDLRERADFLLKSISNPQPVKDATPKPVYNDPNEGLITEASKLTNEMVRETQGDYKDPYIDAIQNEEPSYIKPSVDTNVINLKVHYDMEFNKLVRDTMASFITGNESEEEVKQIEASVKASIKDALLRQNPEYHELEQKGLI